MAASTKIRDTGHLGNAIAYVNIYLDTSLGLTDQFHLIGELHDFSELLYFIRNT